jgi:ADP-ribose pyrophosphatase YjhB (NUDIX family)
MKTVQISESVSNPQMRLSRVGGFAETYLGQLRAIVGSRLLLVPGARVILENAAGEILLQYRSDLHVWGLPGGNAEAGEGLEVVAAREVFEETGLIVTNLKPFAFGCDPDVETVTFPNGHQCQFFVLNFSTQQFSGNLKMLDGESLALKWFAKSQLPEMLPNMRKSVAAYERFLQTHEFQMV